MGKLEDLKKYGQELAKKAGLNEEQVKTLLEAFDNETIREGFVMRPDYSRDLDKAAAKAKDKAEKDAKAFYDNWWSTEAKPAYDKAIALQEQYAKYKQLYGDLEQQNLNDGNNNKPPAGMTQEQIDKLISDKLAGVNENYSRTLKEAMRISTQHLKDYGEILDPEELEKFAAEHKYTDIPTAYQNFVAPKLKEKEEAAWQKKLEEAKAEGVKEGRSQAPTFPGERPREYVNPFLKQRGIPEGKDPKEVSRDAFLEVFRESNQ